MVNAERALQVTVAVDAGAVKVSKGAKKDALRCDINTFTQLFSGGLSVAQAKAMNRLQGGSPALGAACDALLHGRVPYRSDAESG